MRWSLIFFTTLSISTLARADSVFRIEFGSDYKQYRDSDLKRKVWELERAVWQLQQKVFDLENANRSSSPKADTWLCQIKAMGNITTGTGPSKAIATEKAIEKCKAENGDGFFCKDPKCTQ